jgi:hypothetical protein
MKKINWILVMGMILGVLLVVLFDYHAKRILTYLAVIPVMGAPLLFSKTRYRLGNIELFVYYLFVFFAYFLGCVIDLYDSLWWYDIVIHFCSGIFTFMIGLFILNRLGKNCFSLGFRLFFGICFVMFIAGIWEFFEFGVDKMLGMNLQHSLDTGVSDTMEDMLAAFGGGMVGMIMSLVRNR